MKTLTLIRHAKSAWDDPGIPDLDRPLNERGQRDALVLAGLLKHLDLRPDRVLASPARRCRETVDAIAREAGAITARLQFDSTLYEAEWTTLLELIQSQGDPVRDLWLCGHNPGLVDLFNRLSSSPLAKMPTCTFARLGFPVERWNVIQTAKGQLTLLLTPKGMA